MIANLPSLFNCTIAVIGLGYVGLPLAVEFGSATICKRTGSRLHRRVIGFDINKTRLEELKKGFDRTNETSSEQLLSAHSLEFQNHADSLSEVDVFIVTVPTPIDNAKSPDLTPLEKASATVGNALKHRTSSIKPVVIYESTVYPGATEEVCVPILQNQSGLVFNKDFYCGYSPERINPGDDVHKLSTIVKVTSGSNSEVAAWVDSFYGSIIEAGTHMAPTLRTAEAAKVIENTQRDLNIALVNELSIIFRHIGVDTLDVLEAAGTKWNFLPFRPGLVGGHCISVDPYYLTYKAEQLGYYPQVVLAGRRINDGMGRWVVDQLVLEMARKGHQISGTNILILGLTFKENCPDLRNTRVVDVVEAAKRYGFNPIVVDPWVDKHEATIEYNLDVIHDIPNDAKFKAVLALVSHRQFLDISEQNWRQLGDLDCIYFDIKGIIPRSLNPIRI